MATIKDCLTAISMFPIPSGTINEVALRRELDLFLDATEIVAQSRSYNLARADLYIWLSLAPTLSQGGQSYSLSEEQRLQFRSRAKAIYEEFGENDGTSRPTFGYKGSRL